MHLLSVYDRLLQHYGPQHWWPGETPFEIMIGAVLTQNTAWSNVEKAIANLAAAGSLDPARIARAHPARLAEWIRPAGYFNVKARRLHNFCRWYRTQGGYEGLARLDTPALRHALLTINGVGPETADDIVLYAFERPVFVIDAYTRRIFSRLGMVEADAPYESLRRRFEVGLGGEMEKNCNAAAGTKARAKRLVHLFNEYHALIVHLGKDVCRKRPLCEQCCLKARCSFRAGA